MFNKTVYVTNKCVSYFTLDMMVKDAKDEWIACDVRNI